MRWKLLIAASLLASAIGAGAVLAIIRFALGSASRVAEPGWPILVNLLLPLASIVFATVFVYRHTARRRTLQATATALLSILLTLGALLAASYFLAPRTSPPTDAPLLNNTT